MSEQHRFEDLHGARDAVEPLVTLVIPALNEALNLAAVLPLLPAVHEVILVDGGSVDGTVQAARRALPEIVTVLQTRTGRGNALAAGFARATGDIVVTFDADGSADPAEIERFVDALRAGADFAKGSRNQPGGSWARASWLRRLGSRLLNGALNLVFRARYTDLGYGFNAFWADLLPLLDLPDHVQRVPGGRSVWGDGFDVETVLCCRFAAAGVSVTEVPSVERSRMFGERRLHLVSRARRMVRTLVTEWRRMRGTRRLERSVRITVVPPAGTELAEPRGRHRHAA